MDLHFHSDQREKKNMWAGNMLMFPAGVNMKRLKIRFNNDTFNDLESNFLLRDNNFKHSAL